MVNGVQTESIDTKLDRLLEARLGPRLDAALERVLARMLGDEPKPATLMNTNAVVAGNVDPEKLSKTVADVVAKTVGGAKPTKRRAAAKRAKAPARPSAAAPTAPARRTGPTPGSPADRIVKALQAGPMNGGEFADVLAKIDASDEAKRQAVTRLQKSGRLVVTQEKAGNVYRLGSPDRPTTGE